MPPDPSHLGIVAVVAVAWGTVEEGCAAGSGWRKAERHRRGSERWSGAGIPPPCHPLLRWEGEEAAPLDPGGGRPDPSGGEVLRCARDLGHLGGGRGEIAPGCRERRGGERGREVEVR